jgi:poly(3-hydroxybutyrate) depolymerase
MKSIHALQAVPAHLAFIGVLTLSCSVDPGEDSAGSAGATSNGGSAVTAGTSSTPTAGATSTSGGMPAAGAPSGGTAQGGSAAVAGAGGTAPSGGSGGAGSGGAAAGSAGSGGGSAGATTGGGASGVPGNYPLKNDPVKSSGCGTQGMATLIAGGTAVQQGLATSKRLKITSGGQQREFIIDIPSDYDNTKPYRLFYTSHWIGSTDTAVATGSVTNGGAENWGFYGLHREAMAANAPAIFVAPQADGDTWQQKDHALFDDILAKVTSSLCIDTSRVFATGFSFGGMITYSLSTNHQKVIRAAVGIAPANYNIYLPNPLPHDPIAWMSTTGMSDGTCPWDGGTGRGAKAIATSRAMDNGCTATATIPTWTSGTGSRHLCYDFQGCKSNYPLKVCTFDGNHQAAPKDSGAGDDGKTSWIPSESWKFFTQF